jgi:hypothetical protein
MAKTKILEDMRDRAAEQLARALNTTGEQRRAAFRETAEILFEVREFFYLPNGDRDVQGRSWDYKQWVREVYSQANVPLDQRAKLQGNIAYHVSSVTRDRLSTEEVVTHGLKPTSLRERRAERREVELVVLHLFFGGAQIAGAEVDTALDYMQKTLERFAPDDRQPAIERAVAAAVKKRGAAVAATSK